MGTLSYSTAEPPIALPDRTLEHLHVVVARKLREHQRFALNIITGASAPIQVWLDARIPMVITYASSVATSLNERWLKELEASFSAAGLVVTAEPAEA
ncbi:hypothetical protein BH09ACT5_BH09ACT5_09540 [soil metagenome]